MTRTQRTSTRTESKPPSDEEALLNLIRETESQADYAAVEKRFLPTAKRHVYHGNLEDAREAVSYSIETAKKKRAQGEERHAAGRLLPWFGNIVKNKARAHCRKNSKHQERRVGLHDAPEVAHMDSELELKADTEKRHRLKAYYEYFSKYEQKNPVMGQQMREIMNLRVNQGLVWEEIGPRVGLSPEAAAQRLCRFGNRFRTWYKKHGGSIR